MQGSCNTVYPTNMVCFRHIIVNTVHEGDSKMMMMMMIIIKRSLGPSQNHSQNIRTIYVESNKSRKYR